VTDATYADIEAAHDWFDTLPDCGLTPMEHLARKFAAHRIAERDRIAAWLRDAEVQHIGVEFESAMILAAALVRSEP